MENIYISVKGLHLIKRGSLNRFSIIALINIYRLGIYKISFPDRAYLMLKTRPKQLSG